MRLLVQSRAILTVIVGVLTLLVLHKWSTRHNQRQLPVIITEESFEGVYYWLRAAATEQIPSHGNTLIYFGRSIQNDPVELPSGKDTIQVIKSNPDVTSHFHMPKSAFQTVLMSGLVNNIIWVWPEWTGGGRPSHTKGTISAGRSGDSPCSCVEIQGTSRVCHSLENQQVQPIDASSCDLFTSCNYEEFNIKSAYEAFADLQSIAHFGQDIILHIDVEFFSSVDRKKLLTDSGLNDTFLLSFNKVIGEHLCPSSSDLELNADEIATTIITNFIARCDPSAETHKCLTDISDSNLIDSFFNDADSLFMDLESSKVFCSTDSTTNKNHITEILKLLKTLNKKQMYAIQQTGFCLNKAPTSSSKVTGILFHLCYTNSSSSDKFHSTSSVELTMTLEYFSQLLAMPSMPAPKIATIARTVRTGTTSSHDCGQAETALLEYLDTFGFIKKYKMYERYDNNLLGGVDGWTRRRAYIPV